MPGGHEAPLFPVSSRIQPTTHGADVWDSPVCTYYSYVSRDFKLHPITTEESYFCDSTSPAILFIDTEGSESLETDNTFDETLHTLVYLVADVIVYNTVKPGRPAIANLDTIAKLAQTFSSDEALRPPSLLWTVQQADTVEWDRPIKQYITDTMRQYNSDHADALEAFCPFQVLGMPFPSDNWRDAKQLDEHSLTDLLPHYQESVHDAVGAMGQMLRSRDARYLNDGKGLAHSLQSVLDALSHNPLAPLSDRVVSMQRADLGAYTERLEVLLTETLEPLFPLSDNDFRDQFMSMVATEAASPFVSQAQIDTLIEKLFRVYSTANRTEQNAACDMIEQKVEDIYAKWDEQSGWAKMTGSPLIIPKEVEALKAECLGLRRRGTHRSIDSLVDDISKARLGHKFKGGVGSAVKIGFQTVGIPVAKSIWRAVNLWITKNSF
ncbi:hypothetical protein KIPB_008923 [Kipferlia bialata]|uniref:Guanylate-binding protein N-terminal domain-containing protein n=1 Tax=Kipferlia bialata TaxID=797122 RepID=A0A9K3D0R5_9EUKA|nr:hypothetical protein KIPB_008923 [Kipferlia bialata]|eukprot:g8923.t1